MPALLSPYPCAAVPNRSVTLGRSTATSSVSPVSVSGKLVYDTVHDTKEDEHRVGVGVGSELLGHQLALAAAVLQVSEEPVEPGQGAGSAAGAEPRPRNVPYRVSPEAGRLDRSVIHGFVPGPLRMSGRWSGRAAPR